MSKKIITTFRLQIEAGKATPAPPIGPALGQYKLNIMQFVKEYNERTASMDGVVPVDLTVHSDQSFTFVVKNPPTAFLIKKAINIAKGSGAAGAEVIGRITRDQIKQVAETKLEELNAYSLDAAIKIVEGTARSMGVVIDD